MSAPTACQTAFLLALPSSLATVYSLPIATGIVRQKFLKCPVARDLYWALEHCRHVSLTRVLCDCTQPTKQLCRPLAFIPLWQKANEAGMSGGREPSWRARLEGWWRRREGWRTWGETEECFQLRERERERDWGTAVESVFILGKY